MTKQQFKMADTPPVIGIPSEKAERFQNLRKAFENKYGSPPEFYARASGRVNLIGEHIDYCGYAVLPMAIEQDVVIAAAPTNTHTINMANVNAAYSDYSCNTTDIHIDQTNPQWYHYLLCGYRGIQEHFKMAETQGMNLMTDGTIPPSAGLSSSSALVCAAGLVTTRINGKQLTKLELSEICQHCEHYIGTEGGGMDQAISFLAEPGTAKLIEFNPIRPSDTQLPAGVEFVISNSLVEIQKAATSNYNIRVVECRLATQVLAKKKGLPWREISILGDLQARLAVSLADMVELVKSTLHPEPYSKAEICDILQLSPDELAHTSLSEKVLQVDSFKLYDRAVHVYSEASRVWAFKEVCDKQPHNTPEVLGQLMNDSHSSCRDLYECSHPELDQLVALCVESGALGSRLTGAGWGGCAVSMVPANQVKAFLQKVQDGYYAKDPRKLARVSTSLFATAPAGGAVYYID